ncbi:MAG: hypothetical protein J5698_00235, partial [Bacteroidaceae bacterium]|nr:hypothetical protein [Bacteroidaceae bacterium]
MKKFVTFIIAAMLAAGVNAQLVVDESGNVAVGYSGNASIVSDFSVNSEGHSSATANIKSLGNTYGLYVDEALEEEEEPEPINPVPDGLMS